MKAGRLIGLFGFIFGLLIFSFTAVYSLAVDQPRIVNVGVYDNQPKIYRESNGKISGLFADILDFIAIQENWTINYVFGSFSDGLNRLERGEVDIMVDVAYSEERAVLYSFTTEPVLGSWGVVYVRKDSDIENFQDLHDKRVGILSQSVYLHGPQGISAYIDSFDINVKLVEVQEYAQLFEELDRGEIDAVVVSRIFGLSNEKKYPRLKATNIFFDPTELRFALNKNNPESPYLIERLDYWLLNLKGGYRDFYRDSLQKYGLLEMVIHREVIPAWIWTSGAVILGALVISLLSIFVLRRARESISNQLKEKEFLLTKIVNEMPMFIASCDDRGIITLVEGKGADLVGLKPEKVVGKSVFKVFKDNRDIISHFKKALSGSMTEFRTAFVGRSWLTTLIPIKSKEHVVSIIGTAIDYSETAKIEKTKIEFIKLASHHLRTPSTQIKWSQTHLWPSIKSVLKGKDITHWDNITKANLSIIHLADILTLSSWLELTTFTTTPKKSDIHQIADDEINKLKGLIDEKNLKLVRDYQSIPNLYLDIKKTGIIINSLISNSIRYSSSGGTININLKYDNNLLRITVKDTGWGIPRDQQDKIFQKFFRADNVAKKDPYGIGMSLHICKTIVDNMGGKIWFESELNQGSIFYVEFPAPENEIV